MPDASRGTGGGNPGDGGGRGGDTGVGGDDGGPPALIAVAPTRGLRTSEWGRQAFFTVVLSKKPTAPVSIAIDSSNKKEGAAAPASLTFTPDNYNAPQSVSVTGVDDAVKDGDQTYTIVTSSAGSTDPQFNGFDPADVTVVNIDDESPGFIVEPTNGLMTSESGEQATFTIVLTHMPSADVTVAVKSDSTTEGTVSAEMLTFTNLNWNAPQTVTVTGVDDAMIADGPQTYHINLGPAQSSDTSYDGMVPSPVTVVNEDNDTPGFTVKPVTGLKTSELGAMATFTVVLNAAPTADVTIGLTSSNVAEGIPMPTSLTFTTRNWNAPQSVTITGIDDQTQDGDQLYLIVTSAAMSADPGYDGKTVPDVLVANVDNDTAGVTLSRMSGLVTGENGDSDTFTVVLNSRPTADVVMNLTTMPGGEGAVSPARLTFTKNNYNAPQTVTLTGLNDPEPIADGNQPYAVRFALTSDDTTYAKVPVPDVLATNIDDDSAGVVVRPTTGLVTRESDADNTATFTVVLTSKPFANVIIPLSSTRTAEGTVSPATLTFTPNNYNAPQTVTVTGVNDAVDDGDQPYRITIARATSMDAAYAAIDPTDVTVMNVDDDTAGITVAPTTGLTTTEAGGSTRFTVVLNSQPTAGNTVMIAVNSTNTAEGTISPASVTFTTVNWNAPQTVTITGVNDNIDDGNQQYRIHFATAVSGDMGYNGRAPLDLVVTNTDNDTAGITVSPTTGLQTTEQGAGTATFTIVLNSQPTAGTVSIGLSSSRTAEGTVSPGSVTFTTNNWNAPQTVTVMGVNDNVDDGNQVYSIVTAASTATMDMLYAGINAPDVSVTNIDDDSAGFRVTPTTGLTTTEAGGTATFTVALQSQPTANVVIPVTSSRTAEGTVSPASLTFTNANWNAPQTVTVTGVNDNVQDGNQPYTIVLAAATSTDANYSGLNPPDVAVSNTDNDTAGITVRAAAGLQTTETGGTATFTIVLNSQPAAGTVSIGLTSSRTAEGTVSPASVTFTTTNWNAPQTVTVTGVNDNIDDGNQPYSIVTAASTATMDTLYAGINAPDVAVTNVDDDSAGFRVTPTTGLATTEAGGSATFMVALQSQPTANVVIGVTSSRTAEGTVSPATLTFTNVNWNAPQTVTVIGINDNVQDGNQPYTIVLAAATSTDANYSGLNPPDVAVSNTDNDSAGITVTPITGLQTAEMGPGTAMFTIVLNSQPASGTVSIGLTSSNTREGTVSPASVTFTTTNWNAPQTVTVTGVDDSVDDGNQTYTIVTAPSTAAAPADPNYVGINALDVAVTNIDNDSAGFRVTPTSGLITTESGGTAMFTVALQSQPTANVAIGVTSGDTTEGTVGPGTLTFTTLNWNAPQTVTVTGVNDNVQDGNQVYAIALGVATSTDTSYNGLNPPDVSVTNSDNDSVGINVTPTSGLQTAENVPATGLPGTAMFTIALNSQPTAGTVSIVLSSSRPTEGTVGPTSVTFTTANWNTPQTITVTGVNDAIDDGNQPYTIITAASTATADATYDGINPTDVSVTNVDDDSAAYVVTPTTGLITSEGGVTAMFSVTLRTQPTGNVVLNVASSNTAEGTVSSATLTFTPANFNTAHPVTITGVNDTIPVQDGNQPYTVRLTVNATATMDAVYAALEPPDVSVTNNDNDTAGITLSTRSVPLTEGASGMFTVVLNSQPSAGTVTVPFVSSDGTQVTVTASVMFTTLDWNTPKPVTVTAVNDSVSEALRTYTITAGPPTATVDTNYPNVPAATVSVPVTDNDVVGILVNAAAGLTTRESGGPPTTFTVALRSQPTANVTVTVASDTPGEGTVVPPTNSLTFTSANWNTPQTVNVVGVQDSVVDGSHDYLVTVGPATGGDYAGQTGPSVSLTNLDDDVGAFTIVGGVCDTSAGATFMFTIQLSVQPAASVIVALSAPEAEATVDRSSITFTTANWDVPVPVTVTGADPMPDAPVSYNVTASGSGLYTGVSAAVMCVNSPVTVVPPIVPAAP